MADHDSRFTDGTPLSSGSTGSSVESRLAGPADGNSASPSAANVVDPTTGAPSSAADDRSGLDRAEEMVDFLAGKISSLTSNWGRKFLRLSSRTRESAEDFWAEVQDFRHGKKP
jgi:hypothetical protein